MNQLRLPLGPRAAQDEFIVTDSNAAVIQQLERWATWPVMAALLVGPPRSGRTLLASIFTAKAGGAMIDDAEQADESAIFHAWNQAQRERHPLIIVADRAPPEWHPALPDLGSRLAASPILRIGPPDDDLILALLTRELERRELLARPEFMTWLARRIERSHAAVFATIDALQADSDRRDNSRLSIPTARATLQEAGLLVEPSPQP